MPHTDWTRFIQRRLVLLAIGAVLVGLTSLGARAAQDAWPTWEGWELMGSAGVFSYDSGHNGKGLLVSTSGKGSALRKSEEQPLTPDLEFSWQWQVAEIPSTVAEDTKEKHHYFAVSVIFDNGKNLSYIWSAALPKEYGFQCPLDDWKDKETHVVVESGPSRFNQVLSYRRNIEADYRHFIGGQLPAKVSKVWIVALATGGEKGVKARVTKLAIESRAHGQTDYL